MPGPRPLLFPLAAAFGVGAPRSDAPLLGAPQPPLRTRSQQAPVYAAIPYLGAPNEASGLPILWNLNLLERLTRREKPPLPQYDLTIFGVTKDSTGAVLGGCTVHLFRTADDSFVTQIVSDATTGAYRFTQQGLSSQQFYYVVAYKTGSPDVTGTTINTIVGS